MSTVNREQLVRVALEIVDEQGSDALTMRTLAGRVHRQVSSLYNHVGSRDELIELVRAHIVRDIDTSAFGEHPWDVALEAWARSYLTAFAAHPNLIRVLATTPIRDVSTFEIYDVVIGALIDAGWPMHHAVAVMRTVEAHVLGSALDIVAPSDMLDQASVPAELEMVHAALAPEYQESTSAIAAFEIGMAALLDGLRARRAAALTPVD
ncbi:TetR/AcrR family transcriptional regulator C-terminal domain-containing protein [Agromyces sp. H3Y2-19a]|jgi:AcrR family transcriptional regulator|uniref:TetR/AcrR family transcriptional regulator C-terminal domain-containing protein n=1 Tax=Agromyces TaxID=33877 RepID=UPI001E48C104|nr:MULTISPECIES: TetR/AcrR family transcriptional regulator C-terminal domain-containing protein [Agromyces]MCD5345192.1 TetR/AcrR family transcriptional regulator C-terminal domain-containing protein [Agromyces sp. S2-1-8]MDF0513649.1 TetR/AcrR family transcriptional regulator C-terminal domain-containing protein [Agromyces chromiiresistens]